MAAKKLSAKHFKLLSAINAATLAGGAAPFMFAAKADVQPIIDFGTANNPPGPLVQFNENVKDPNDANKVAFATTTAGQTYVAENAKPAAGAEGAGSGEGSGEAKVKPTFAIEEVTDLPEAPKGRTREAVYPFADLKPPRQDGDRKVYTSFFVPLPEGDDMAKFRKKFNSTVANAQKRLNKDKPEAEQRAFTLREAEATGPDGTSKVRGLRIYRAK